MVAEGRRLVDEVLVMSQLDHIHVVRLHAFYEDAAAFYIITELMTGGELFDRIVTRTAYSEREARDIVRTLAEALCYMHSKGIAHRDLKPENILLSSPDEAKAIIKLADMGFAKRVALNGPGLSTSCGTPSYVSPDVLLGKKYGTEVDIWSLGVITYILLCGYAPFAASNQTDLFRSIVQGKFYFDSPYWDKVSADAKDLIRRLLVVDPRRRYTAQDILQHRWFQGTVSSTELSSALSSLQVFQAHRRQIIKRGTLRKVGHIFRSTKTRSFVLTSDTLEYYDPVVEAVISGDSNTSTQGNGGSFFMSLLGFGKDTSEATTPTTSTEDGKVAPSLSAAAMAAGTQAFATPALPSALAGLGRPKGIVALKNIKSVCAVDAYGREVALSASVISTMSSQGEPSNETEFSPWNYSPKKVPTVGDFWFKIACLDGKDYMLCADTEAARADWLLALSSTLQHGELVRKAAVAMAGERMAEAVALMKLAQDWSNMITASQQREVTAEEEAAVASDAVTRDSRSASNPPPTSARAVSTGATPSTEAASGAWNTAVPGTVSSTSAGGGLRAVTLINSKVTRAFANSLVQTKAPPGEESSPAATAVEVPAPTPVVVAAPVVSVSQSAPADAPPSVPSPTSVRPVTMMRHQTCGEEGENA
jgi:serine/threonine protein kinase